MVIYPVPNFPHGLRLNLRVVCSAVYWRCTVVCVHCFMYLSCVVLYRAFALCCVVQFACVALCFALELHCGVRAFERCCAVFFGVLHVPQYMCETGAECPFVFKWSRVFELHCAVQSIRAQQGLASGLCCAVLGV